MMADASKSQRRKLAKSNLMKVLDDDAIGVGFAELMAGDRAPMPEEEGLLREVPKRCGGRLYSDLIFALTHQYYPAGKAHVLWDAILSHKLDLERRLGRGVGVTIAAADYLTNIEKSMRHPIIMTEPGMNLIAEVAIKDGLTRLFDQSTFRVKLHDEIKRVHRYQNELAVLMLDLDHFKDINDRYGHPVGDRILREFSDILLSSIRDIDIAARYGGEEFAILLPRTNEEDAGALAERIRMTVEQRFRKQGRVTVSIGVAVSPHHGESEESVICAADRALYYSKEHGRNRVTSCSAMLVAEG